MGDREKLRNNVICNLRACLLSAKGGVSFSELNSDYRKIMGDNIPFRQLGHQSLDDFLSSVENLCITKRGTDWIIAAKPTETTVHLAQLIARQKSAPKRRSRGPGVRHRRPSANVYRRPTFQTTRPTSSSSRSNQSNYRATPGPRSQNVAPLMSMPQRRPPLFEELPRYMVRNSATPQASTSRQLPERRANTGRQSPNLVIRPVIAYKNQAAMQALLNGPSMPNTSTPVHAPSPLLPTPRPGPSNENSAPLKPLSERLKCKPPVVKSPIRFPLSPGQLVDQPRNSPWGSNPPPAQTPIAQAPVTWPLSPQHQDACKQLDILAQTMKPSEPVYKVISWGPKNKFYACQVKVGTDSYSSYPEEITSPDEARRVAAAKAVKEIIAKTGPLLEFEQTTNKNLVKERMIAIVSDHRNGVFMHQIPNYYKEQFRENLPQEWEKIVEECSDICKEKGAHDSIILRPYVPRLEVSGPDTVSEVISPRLEKIQLSPIGPPVPEVLKPPTEQYWDVCITSVLSTTDIWARLIGEEYSGRLDTMLNEMEAYYNKHASSSGKTDIQLGSYYAVKAEEDSWHRVQCYEYDPCTGMAGVFFIDHGDEDIFHHRKLFPLEKRFCTVPAQAVNLSLADLEEFSDNCEVMDYLGELLGESLVAQVVDREDKDEDDWTASVVLYDTKQDYDVNLNDVLLTKICKNILTPKLNQDGQVSEVFVSHVTEKGDVYLQVKSQVLSYLANLMNKLIQTGLKTEDVQRSEAKDIVKGQLYLARGFGDGAWYRGVVTSLGTVNATKVSLVDMGKIITVDKKAPLLVLDQLSAVLARFPHQAVKVKLHNIPDSMFNAEMAGKLAVLAPPKDQLLVKVVKPGSQFSSMVVELFKRLEPDNFLVSINHTLAIDPELIGSNGDGNNNTRPRKRLERTISRHGTTGDGELMTRNLKPPKIPDFGELFNVHVTMAANPGNFTVQPHNDRGKLEDMMVLLQEVCVNYMGLPPSHESIKEGSLFAAKHNDNHYYRVCVSKILDQQLVSVYFCDFGDVTVVTLDKLQPLGKHFLDLPYQAIRARLVGVQPMNIDWSVEDCIRFQELVVERDFASIVVESGPDPLSPGDTVLGLKLIDVSGEDDLYLDQLLVAERRATPIEG